ncbi:hypothetical protein Tco_0651370, partial [Tanacetum coccineum]
EKNYGLEEEEVVAVLCSCARVVEVVGSVVVSVVEVMVVAVVMGSGGGEWFYG